MLLTKEEISSGVEQAKLNTWGSRYHPTFPSIEKEGAVIKLIDGNLRTELTSFDEIVLSIILKFCFCPTWLIKKFYKNDLILGEDVASKKIRDWIRFGLIWKEESVTGTYIRPTYQLFSLFGMQPGNYTNIPFNMLIHTIVEEDMMFKVMTGDSIICKNEKSFLLPRVSELGFDNDYTGTNIIGEDDFRNPKLYTQEGIMELSQAEHDINEAMRNKSKLSPELTDFRMFTLVKKINNTGEVKKDYKFHVPDLIIPCFRYEGQPKSIAIEMELSNKRGGYVETMERYKNCNKYGSVYWFCSNPATIASLRDAYKQAGGTGTTKSYIIEYTIPFPKEV